MNVGDRVITVSGSIGYIESIDGDFADVRYLTPKNEPSCCVGILFLKNLKPVGENVIPAPKSEEWYEEARKFHSVVESAIEAIKEGEK